MRNPLRNPYARLALSATVALLVTAAILTTQRPAVQYRTVAVLTQDVEPNTELTSDHVALQRVPESLVPPGALDAVPKGKRAAQKLWKGQVLLPGMLVEDPLAQPSPDHRVLALPVDLASAGALRPGDLIDVILITGDPKRGVGESRLIASALPVVRVLNQQGRSVTESTSPAAGSSALPAVVEVLVTAADAPVLAAAVHTGAISVARYLPESRPVPVPTVSLDQLSPVVTQP